MRPANLPHDFPSDLFWASQAPLSDDDANEAALRLLNAAELSPDEISGLRIIDVGCGRGEIALALARLGADVTGIDYDPERIAEANARAANTCGSIAFLTADASHGLPGDPYDLAYCFYSGWGYGGLQSLQNAFASIRTGLKPDGVFVAETHNADLIHKIFNPSLRYDRIVEGETWQVGCHGVYSHAPDRNGIGRIHQIWSYTDPKGVKHPARFATFEPIGFSSLALIAASTGFEDPEPIETIAHVKSTPGQDRLLLRFRQSTIPTQSSLAQRITAQWAMLRNETALRDHSSELSGQSLLDAATHLEMVLQRAGNVANKPIAVVMPRSWAWPVALLACRRAGAIFAPIDPDQPDMRIRNIIDGLSPAAVLCFSEHESRMSMIADNGHGVLRMLPPGSNFESLSLLLQYNSKTLPEPISHIFHTSGSTGNPKGVLLAEEGLIQVIEAQIKLLPPAPGASLWALGPGFDASLSDVLCPIFAGRVLHIHRPSASRLHDLKDVLSHVDAADLPPSMLPLLRDQTANLPGLVFGGERAPSTEIARFYGRPYGFQAYGPTEASICAMTASFSADWTPGILGQPLIAGSIGLLYEGRIHNVANSIASPNAITVDPPLPPEATAEIIIIGDLVAHGYLNAPEMTNERFGSIGQDRIHYTGDLARIDQNRLIWIGRSDRQAKINGRMVCPEEIELAVSALVPAARAHVLIQEDRIRLFVSDVPAPENLSQMIVDRLGPTFRPASIHSLDRMPLGTSGKPDASKLLALIS